MDKHFGPIGSEQAVRLIWMNFYKDEQGNAVNPFTINFTIIAGAIMLYFETKKYVNTLPPHPDNVPPEPNTSSESEHKQKHMPQPILTTQQHNRTKKRSEGGMLRLSYIRRHMNTPELKYKSKKEKN